MAKEPVYLVEPSPTNANWKITREGETTPLLFADSKKDAEAQAAKMAKEHGGTVKVTPKTQQKRK